MSPQAAEEAWEVPTSSCGVADAEVARALRGIAAGGPVLVLDEAGDCGELVLAADTVTASGMAFVVRHGSGLVFVAMPESDCRRLALPPMTWAQRAGPNAAHRVSVDAATGITTGISAADRARTARILADERSGADALRRPGHIIPVAVRPAAHSGGPLGRPAAALHLVGMAGNSPAAVLCQVVSIADPRRMATVAELRTSDFAQLPVVSLAQVGDCLYRNY